MLLSENANVLPNVQSLDTHPVRTMFESRLIGGRTRRLGRRSIGRRIISRRKLSRNTKRRRKMA